MRKKLTAVIVVGAIVVAGFPTTPVLAQSPVTPVSAESAFNPELSFVSTINAFPNGGEPLKAAISDLIVHHPDYAASLASYLRSDPILTPAQKQAVVAGLADALNRMGVVAQSASGMDPMMIALLIGAAGAAVFGLFELTKNKSCGSAVSPNC
jgi:hypothetical protein